MSHLRSLSCFFVIAAVVLLAMATPVRAQTLFEGARLITGDGPAIENSAFIVTGTRRLGT